MIDLHRGVLLEFVEARHKGNGEFFGGLSMPGFIVTQPLDPEEERLRKAQYRACNRKKVRARDAAYNATERGRARLAAYRANNPGKVSASNQVSRKKYYIANRAAILAKKAARYRKTK